MGRRSVHTPEELRHLILGAARGIVEREGLVGLSAREVARLIGYSAGTLYNIFENLDDVLLTLQSQMLGDVVERMKSAPRDHDPKRNFDSLVRCYVNFALENRKLWNLLFAHPLPPGTTVPPAFEEYAKTILAMVAEALTPLTPSQTPEAGAKAASTLWGGVHGTVAIAVTSKAPTLNVTTVQASVADLTSTFIKGLKAG